MYTFQNELVRLRAVEEEDAQDYTRWFNDYEITRNLVSPRPYSLEDELAHIRRIPESGNYVFGIEAIDGDKSLHIGNCAIHKPDWRNRSADVGIVIGERTHLGRGYGTAAMKLLLEYGFGELNLHRVSLRVYDFNARARRSYEKCGFQLDGTLRDDLFRDGVYHDVHVMSILRSKWDALVGRVESSDAGT